MTFTISGDVATLLGVDHTTGDPVALWVECSQPVMVVGATGLLGGRLRVTVASDGTFSEAGLPASVGDLPLYRLVIDSRSLRLAGNPRGLTTNWFPLTADRDLTWIVANYVTVTVITEATATNVAAAAALGATNDTATASYVNNPASATAVALAATYATKTGAETLTNKTVSADNNALNGFPASSFVVTDGTGKADGAAAQKVVPAGVVVGTTDTQTLTNKTLTAPAMTAPTATGSLSGFGGAYSTYTPTLTGFTASTNVGRIWQIGKHVEVTVRCVITAVSGSMIVSLPTAAINTTSGFTGIVTAGDAGVANYVGAVVLNSVSNVLFIPSPSSAGIFNGAIPFTWGSGDTLSFTFAYEAA